MNDERLQRLNLWTLEGRRVQADFIDMFKIINGLTNLKFSLNLTPTTERIMVMLVS